jgi:hypothetical protein
MHQGRTCACAKAGWSYAFASNSAVLLFFRAQERHVLASGVCLQIIKSNLQVVLSCKLQLLHVTHMHMLSVHPCLSLESLYLRPVFLTRHLLAGHVLVL